MEENSIVSKRQKISEEEEKIVGREQGIITRSKRKKLISSSSSSSSIASECVIQFISEEGVSACSELVVPTSIKREKLIELLNKSLGNEVEKPYTLNAGIGSKEGITDSQLITESLHSTLAQIPNYTSEGVLWITYNEEAIFEIRPITRATSTLEGHKGEILALAFSPNGGGLATGGGDNTLRLWDVYTETPLYECKAHTGWVITLGWSPDSETVASGGMDGMVMLWDPSTGKKIGGLKGHTKWVTSVSWVPLHLNKDCSFLASSSKDCTIKIWDVRSRTIIVSMAAHSSTVTKVIWGGEGLLYSASHDRSIKVWDKGGKLVRELKGHAHWINTLALSTDFVLRTGCNDYKHLDFNSRSEMSAYALTRYKETLAGSGSEHERLVSGSDDFSMFLWEPATCKKPIYRMTGHQQLINQVSFSPDTRLIASASFDKSIKVWNSRSGKYICTLRGHVGSVYQVTWSADSRLLLSGSKDTTLKIWDVVTRKLMFDLPGHADEVFAIDWSPDGERAASGSKDHVLRIWKN